MILFKVTFMNGNRRAYTQARSISEAVTKVTKALKDSEYTSDERGIIAVEGLATETWPGVFGG